MGPASGKPTPSTGTPAGTAEDAIRELNTQLVVVSSASDLAGWLARFTDDLVLMPPLPSTMSALIGKEALGSWARIVFGQFAIDETITTEEVEVMGDWGFTRGTYVSTATLKTGSELHHMSGKYLFVVRRQADGSWKYARGMWNLDLPAVAVTEE